MRRTRIIASVALILLAAFSAGCLDKTWSYDFTDSSANIGDWYTTADDTPTFTLDGSGLRVVDFGVISSVSFVGDVTATVYFDFSASGVNESSIGLGFSSVANEGGGSVVQVELVNPGSTSGSYPEAWYYVVFGPNGYNVNAGYRPIPGFVVNGMNKVELALKGDTLKVSINGRELYTGNAIHFERISSHLVIYGDIGENASMMVKRIEVRYAGELIEEYPAK